jgi:cell division protein FtsI (penicillin-binding protein 3)
MAMAATVVIRDTRRAPRQRADHAVAVRLRRRTLITLASVLACFAVIAGQLVRLAVRSGPEVRVSLSEPLAGSWARPDIVDRQGRLLATDVAVHSLYADPQLIIDLDEVIEKVTALLPALDAVELRKVLSDRNRRFAWVSRGLTPRQAQSLHELGLPGLAFRHEPRRAYPLGTLAGHVLGAVNIDNKGLGGVERLLDESGRVEAVQGVGRLPRAPVTLTLDIGVQHALAEELKGAQARYGARAAAGLVLDAENGEIVAAATLPETDPGRPSDLRDEARPDRLTAGAYELGSIFKVMTVAMALEAGVADLDKVYDVRQPLTIGPYTIKDPFPQNRPLTVREIVLHSSNVGAGMLALEMGAVRQREFLAMLGLLEPLRAELGPVAAPLIPKHWGKAETITIGYGHGLAVAPLQFAAAFAALVNGGEWVAPTLLQRHGEVQRRRIVTAATSAKLRELMRLNVTHTSGTGRRAEADGYRVGGKTGTAEMAEGGVYRERSVISTFAGAFPMDAPRYVTLVMLFEPQTGDTGDRATAGLNAAPATARVVERIAPLLGILPRFVETRAPQPPTFDASPEAQ